MTASRTPTEASIECKSFVSPIVDYEPPPLGDRPPPCPPPTLAALHRHTPRPLRPVHSGHTVRELPPPRAAAVFADAALRRVLEVSDRRRPIAALRPLLAPPLVDTVVALSRTPSKDGCAVLRRVRIRTAELVDGEATAAEMFGTYTRGRRVHALAGRIEGVSGRWRIVALQIG